MNIVNPLLAYILFSLHSGTVENVRNAVIDHFPLDIIINAKNILWDSCDHKLIGEKIKRKGSTICTENEANVTDILSALQKLDRSNKLPNVLIDHKDLSMIPRSHSLYNFSICKYAKTVNYWSSYALVDGLLENRTPC